MNSKIIAAVYTDDDFETALLSESDTIFFLYADIAELSYAAKKAHEKDKKLFIHFDLTTGLGKDKSGMEFALNAGIDGIITTRTNMVKLAKECGIKSVQRFFAVDSHSINMAVETIKSSKPDFIEIMPGIAVKIIKRIKKETDIPIIAGGFIETCDEAVAAINAGADSISTGEQRLWGISSCFVPGDIPHSG